MPDDKELIQKIKNYIPSESALAKVRSVPLLLAVGITAAGKDTVLHRLIQRYPDGYRFSVSHSTRKPRVNNGVLEKDGVKYYFIDKPTAIQMLDEGAFVEANYFSFNFYGASIAELERASQDGKILVSDIDVNGIGNFVKLGLNAKPVFLLPPSFEVWQERLNKRYAGEFNQKDIRKRLQTALDELQKAIDHDYFYILINDDLEQTVSWINDIAHGKHINARAPRAMELARNLADHISEELAKLD